MEGWIKGEIFGGGINSGTDYGGGTADFEVHCRSCSVVLPTLQNLQ